MWFGAFLVSVIVAFTLCIKAYQALLWRRPRRFIWLGAAVLTAGAAIFSTLKLNQNPPRYHWPSPNRKWDCVYLAPGDFSCVRHNPPARK